MSHDCEVFKLTACWALRLCTSQPFWPSHRSCASLPHRTHSHQLSYQQVQSFRAVCLSHRSQYGIRLVLRVIVLSSAWCADDRLRRWSWGWNIDTPSRYFYTGFFLACMRMHWKSDVESICAGYCKQPVIYPRAKWEVSRPAKRAFHLYYSQEPLCNALPDTPELRLQPWSKISIKYISLRKSYTSFYQKSCLPLIAKPI